ncbi:phosphatidylinositol 4,5-bisphosphate 3-kinase catalytic subunit delta isoform [Drosophila ficusphila]|uniref:phosphatidylinositol 4,5-bisphosphate 3-kinase catalytic subunit delta isoform n=1 Tax=Drosophila ficusphila TaxID=30025 RepID=UPI0007E87144|nr:phosphatidylinositol 4,5-bisphosphate 3-kinase catalytic subunit delta isoform [Drosophila ficusphila]XP_017048809.1 phosphatidylinositol 4,5-bisphosphate 3-kinase catalytic subunit delta isoform [Drosophila ficusphila]XP_017048810.1 phosphatidylinositol 4,5-bisphosphate 3-kinase catalytic subunit delta isoform [Drosophila ficusphila]
MMDNRQLAYAELQMRYEPPVEDLDLPYMPFSFNLWKNEPPDWVDLICMLPNGSALGLRVTPATTIQLIKAEMVSQGKKMALSHVIKEACEYQVYGISAFNIEPYTDETKRLSEVQPYFGLLVLGDRTDTNSISSDYELTKMVSGMIGQSFDHHRTQGTPEIDDFRLSMMQITDSIEMERNVYTWQQRLLYEHPLRLANSSKMPELIRERHQTRTFLIVVKNELDQSSFTLSVNEQDTPLTLTESTLQKMNRSQMKMNDRATDYILKVSGRDEYLLGDYPLIQFLYIQETLSDTAVPNVVLQLVYRLESYINHHNEQAMVPKRPPPKKQPALLPKTPSSLWDMGNYFQLTLHSISNVNYDRTRAFKVGVHVGLFHGEQKLCAQRSADAPNNNSNTFLFNDLAMDFDIQMRNLPRMTRLCIVIFEVTKMSRSKKSSNNKDTALKDVSYNKNPLAWVNTTLFDYKDNLRSGRQTLYTWTYADDIQSVEVFHPLSTIEPNPRKEECARVELTFHSGSGNVVYPSEEVVLQYAADRAQATRKENLLQQQPEKPLKELKDLLANYTGLDKIYEMVDQDRNAIWERRNDIMREVPEELSILLHCVYWKERDDVADIWYLLKQWPLISIERSLELLDYAYPDPAVRRFAIRCLQLLKDEDLLLYLLQLVQAIKHESYLESDLVVFLLERALRNQRIGHYFFWHLRSEMQTPSIQTRFGLLLEVYLKGCKHHVAPLRKQLHVLEKLKQGSLIAIHGGSSKEKVKAVLQNFLRDQRNSAVFQNIQNPLNPSFRCSGVISDRCKVMDSKMRPLWVVFQNADVNSSDVHIIFKNGDDLRQDMLTLQMLRVMDKLWKNDGLDFRMNIYNCISMDQRLGMIEVVRHAETIANIQKEKGMFSATSPFKKGSLLSWLKEHNRTADKLNKAINEFTLSCAGYCVATYVLGVADRHSDNIMVKKNGQLFHIDFGHILGHFKEKFKVRRERVPFVLTHDFVYVINKGCTDREAKEFCHFQKLCERAFLVLRKHGCLILSLFSMMISTGLPELSSEKDLNYLRETLVLDYTEEKAREHFQAKFSEALVNSWKTSLNWASHNFSKNNKQ